MLAFCDVGLVHTRVQRSCSGFDHFATRAFLPFAVLATDMEAHADLVRDFSSHAACLGPDLAAWDPEQRLLAMQMLVHCADIGNPVKPPALSMNWAARITSEFLLQVPPPRQAHVLATAFMGRS